MPIDKNVDDDNDQFIGEDGNGVIDGLGCYLPGKVICLPDPKIQEYPVVPGKTIFTALLPGKKSKSMLILRQ